jgi:Crp-like helix-turn-helix protein
LGRYAGGAIKTALSGDPCSNVRFLPTRQSAAAGREGQEQIADHVGLTTVHVNRVLRRFREMRMVSIQRNEVLFQENVAALEELARPVQDLVGE